MIGVALLFVAVLLLLGALRWAAGNRTIHAAQGSGIIESIPDAIEKYPLPSHTLAVMSFNLAYGLGTQRGADTTHDAVTIYDRLDQVVETIAGSGADVVLLQAVDFCSRRTHYIDQLHHIAAALGWGFAARAETWACRYLPYPVWPCGRPLGPVRAGMGVISRFPLLQNMRQRLPQPRPSAVLAARFQPFHMVQRVDVQCGAQVVRLFNVHLHSGEAAERLAQAQALVTFVQQMATPNSVLMGSFHAAAQAPDSAMNLIVDGLRDRLHMVDDTQLTYPAMAPHSRRDHVFIASGLQLLETQVVMTEQPVTHHLPLITHLRWQLPMLTQDGRSTHERL